MVHRPGLVVLVIFGGSQLPKLAKNLGKAQKEFKDGLGRGVGEARLREDPEEIAAELRRRPQGSCRRQGRRSSRSHRGGVHAAVRSRHHLTVATLAVATGPVAAPGSRARRSRPGSASGGARQSTSTVEPAALQDAAPLTLAAPTPHAVVDAVLEGVLQARLGDRAAGADLARLVDAHAVAGEERRRGVEAAVAVGHPRRGRVLGVRSGGPSVPCSSLLLPVVTVSRPDIEGVDALDDVRRCPTVPGLGKSGIKIRRRRHAIVTLPAARRPGHRVGSPDDE